MRVKVYATVTIPDDAIDARTNRSTPPITAAWTIVRDVIAETRITLETLSVHPLKDPG